MRNLLLLLSALVSASVAAEEVKAGHTKLEIPSDQVHAVYELSESKTGGDPLPIERKVVVLFRDSKSVAAVVLLEAPEGHRRYVWTDSCRTMQNSPKVFVRMPTQQARAECVYVVHVNDLADTGRTRFAEVHRQTTEKGTPLPSTPGYVINGKLLLASGQGLSATVFVPEPFRGLEGQEPDRQGSGVSPSVISWALALGEHVNDGMLSLSGRWSLPPLN